MSDREDWTKVVMEDTGVHDFELQNELTGVLKKFQEDIGPNESNLYTIEKEDGTLVSVWGSTVLDNKMQMVPLGSAIKIVYQGKATSEKTKRTYKEFDVFYKESAPPASTRGEPDNVKKKS